MKRSKGIGPNNLGVSKSAVQNQNKGYAGGFTAAKQVSNDNAEVKKKEQPDASGKKPPKDPKQTMAGSMAEKSNYGDSGSAMPASKYGAMLAANIEKGMNPTEAGKQAAIDIKKEK